MQHAMRREAFRGWRIIPLQRGKSHTLLWQPHQRPFGGCAAARSAVRLRSGLRLACRAAQFAHGCPAWPVQQALLWAAPCPVLWASSEMTLLASSLALLSAH